MTLLAGLWELLCLVVLVFLTLGLLVLVAAGGSLVLAIAHSEPDDELLREEPGPWGS